MHNVNIMDTLVYEFTPLWMLQGVSTGTGFTDHWCSLSAKGKLISVLVVFNPDHTVHDGA